MDQIDNEDNNGNPAAATVYLQTEYSTVYIRHSRTSTSTRTLTSTSTSMSTKPSAAPVDPTLTSLLNISRPHRNAGINATGVIISIVFSVLGLAVLILVIFCCVRRHHARRTTPTNETFKNRFSCSTFQIRRANALGAAAAAKAKERTKIPAPAASPENKNPFYPPELFLPEKDTDVYGAPSEWTTTQARTRFSPSLRSTRRGESTTVTEDDDGAYETTTSSSFPTLLQVPPMATARARMEMKMQSPSAQTQTQMPRSNTRRYPTFTLQSALTTASRNTPTPASGRRGTPDFKLASRFGEKKDVDASAANSNPGQIRVPTPASKRAQEQQQHRPNPFRISLSAPSDGLGLFTSGGGIAPGGQDPRFLGVPADYSSLGYISNLVPEDVSVFGDDSSLCFDAGGEKISAGGEVEARAGAGGRGGGRGGERPGSACFAGDEKLRKRYERLARLGWTRRQIMIFGSDAPDGEADVEDTGQAAAGLEVMPEREKESWVSEPYGGAYGDGESYGTLR